MPERLSRAVLTREDAYRSGLKRWHLEGSAWRRIGPRTYVPSRLAATPEILIAAASRRLPAGAAFSGFTAAWMHGLDVDPGDPIEITIPAPTTVSGRVGMRVRRRELSSSEVVEVRGYRVTSMARTLRDLCPRMSLTEAVVIADMALHVGAVKIDDLKRHRSTERLVDYAEPATESPMETRLRMLLVLAGLPRPAAQATIRDRWHRFLGRLDLYYAQQRLGLEYDGSTHRDSLAEDDRRQNRLVDAGIHLLRFTAGDIYNSPDAVVRTVRKALR